MCLYLARICWGSSTGCLVWSLCIQVVTKKKNFVAKVLLAIWDTFLHENDHNYSFYRFSYSLLSFLSFLTNQKQESDFQWVGGLVTRNISVFCLYRVTRYFDHAEFNRVLWRKFLTCYSSSYYSFMISQSSTFWLTHSWTMLHVCRNQVVGFSWENVWKTPKKEWHFKYRCKCFQTFC